MKSLLSLLSLPIMAAPLSLASAASSEKPNFIVIFCDDMGYGDLSCFGHPCIKTPNLDKMAQEGEKWTSFYVSEPISSPSRAGMLTGRLGARNGMYGVNHRVLFPPSPGGFAKDEPTMASYLKQAGYTTACVGKWHVGCKEDGLPWNFGFDYYYGSPYSNDMSKAEQAKLGWKGYNHPLPFYQQKEIIEYEPDQTQFTARLTDYATDFIKQHKEEPFFIYLAQPMPHIPIYASEAFRGTSDGGLYGDVVEELDASVGNIMQALKDNGLDKNTIVVFTSDNGPWLSMGDRGGSAGPLRDGKASAFEGGFRVPAIFWGGGIVPKTVSGIGSTLDILPTLCDYAGVELNPNKPVDGVSLKPCLSGEQKESPREEFYYYSSGDLFAIRQGPYKMYFKLLPAYKPVVELETPELYNVNTDPGEKRNIAKKNPEIVKELQELAKKHLDSYEKAEPIFDLPGSKMN